MGQEILTYVENVEKLRWSNFTLFRPTTLNLLRLNGRDFLVFALHQFVNPIEQIFLPLQ